METFFQTRKNVGRTVFKTTNTTIKSCFQIHNYSNNYYQSMDPSPYIVSASSHQVHKKLNEINTEKLKVQNLSKRIE